MIQLYGLRLSNYYSLIKALLIEKNLEFEEVKAPPTQKDDNLTRTPMGKMPSIGVDGKYLSESLAIAQYLDAIAPEPALLPADPWQAAKVMELVYHIKLDVELVARRCLPEAFFGQTVSDETRSSTHADLQRGLAAVNRILICKPYAAGTTMTLADYYLYFCYGLADGISQKMFNESIIEQNPDVASLMQTLAAHPSIARVEEEK